MIGVGAVDKRGLTPTFSPVDGAMSTDYLPGHDPVFGYGEVNAAPAVGVISQQ